MTAPIYPVDLPQYPLIGISESFQPGTLPIETTMEVGSPKIRARVTLQKRQWDNLQLVLTVAQKAIFDAFYVTSCRGGARSFTWVNPSTQVAATLRFVPGSVQYLNLTPALWKITFSIKEP